MSEKALYRLYEQAKQAQWNNSSLDWGSIDLAGLDEPRRASLARVVELLYRTELAALTCVSRLIGELPEVQAKMLASTQAVDDARHIEWLSSLQERLGRRAEPHPAAVEFLAVVHQASLVEEQIIGLLVLEQLSALLLDALGRGLDQGPLDGPLARVGSWMRELMAADEARHTEFVQVYLESFLPCLSPSHREQAERRAAMLRDFFVEHVVPPLCDELSPFGADNHQVVRRGVADLEQRLRAAGFQIHGLHARW